MVLQYDDAWQTSVKDFIYLPAKHAYARGASATNTDRIEAARGNSCSYWDTSLPSKDQWAQWAPGTCVSCWELLLSLGWPHLCRRARLDQG